MHSGFMIFSAYNGFYWEEPQLAVLPSFISSQSLNMIRDYISPWPWQFLESSPLTQTRSTQGKVQWGSPFLPETLRLFVTLEPKVTFQLFLAATASCYCVFTRLNINISKLEWKLHECKDLWLFLFSLQFFQQLDMSRI